MLGKSIKTERGFSVIVFRDAYDKECSLQQSSADGDFVWLGIQDADPLIMKSDAQKLGLELPPGEVSGWMPYKVPAEVLMHTRMHLNREQVQSLVEHLQSWLETGNFE